MQPNNTMNGAAHTAMPAATPVSAPNVAPKPQEDVVFRDKPRKSSGMLVGMIVLALLAAGGIGFGVWAYLSGNQKETELNNKIAEYENQLAELGQSQQSSDDTNIDIGLSSQINPKDYIYIGSWDLKIKIPDGLNNVWYSYLLYGDSKSDGGSIAISGVAGEGFPEFLDPNKNGSGLGALGRVLISEYGQDTCVRGDFVFSDNEYNYCYHHPQAVYSVTEEEETLEVNSVNLIKTMLTQKDNYSKI